VFVNINNPKDIYGCTDILFGYGSTEADVLDKVSETDLCYFGNHLDCEPMGTPAGDIKIVRPEPVAEQKRKVMTNYETIKAAVDAGKDVFWINEVYPLKTWGGNYYVCCTMNNSVVGLTEPYVNLCYIKEENDTEN